MGNDDLDSFLDEIEIKKEIEEYERNSLAHKLNVMLVDDDETIGKTLAPMLPYRVNYTNSALKALQMIDEYTAVAILDIRMPKMDGIELAEKIHSKYPDTFQIVYTAHPGEYTTREILNFKHGLSSFVEKPNTEKLLEEVKIGFNKYANLQERRFFSPDIGPKERRSIKKLIDALIDGVEYRMEEDHEVAGIEEARRYCEGTTYTENADNILIPREIDMLFDLKGKIIADICSGPGGLANAMAKYGAKKVVGIDGSSYMIDFAKKTYQRKNLEFIKSNIDELENGCYDLIICQNSMHHFYPNSRVVEFMNIVNKMLNSRGKFYGMDYRRDTLNIAPLIQRLERTNKNVRRDLSHTFLASFDLKDLNEIFSSLDEKIEFKIFYPDQSGLFKKIQQWDQYDRVVDADPHPHHLDYHLSWRVEATKK